MNSRFDIFYQPTTLTFQFEDVTVVHTTWYTPHSCSSALCLRVL